jgi:membrane-bound lytic murein transglycosylase D
MAGTTDHCTLVTHTIKNGEYFHKIAISYNCTIENIIAWNNLTSLNAYPGQIIKIWIPEKSNF